MDRGARWATIHGVTQSRTRLSNETRRSHLEREAVTPRSTCFPFGSAAFMPETKTLTAQMRWNRQRTKNLWKSSRWTLCQHVCSDTCLERWDTGDLASSTNGKLPLKHFLLSSQSTEVTTALNLVLFYETCTLKNHWSMRTKMKIHDPDKHALTEEMAKQTYIKPRKCNRASPQRRTQQFGFLLSFPEINSQSPPP